MKFFKGLLLVVIIILISSLMPELIGSMSQTVEANDAGWSEDGSEDSDAADFTVVEIVPYKGLGEIGYLVDGEEPFDRDLVTQLDEGTLSGLLSPLGGAFTFFDSYREKPLPAPNDTDSGWTLAKTVVTQNGYFIPGSGQYVLSSGDNYVKVSDKSGNYRVELVPGADMEDAYNKNNWNLLNRKNVKAYFVYGNPDGVTLYNASLGYMPISVTEISDRTGDYDYDLETGTFELNVGHGRYDVIFGRDTSGTPVKYHMTTNYQIVEDGSGFYSFPVRYVSQTNGDYIKQTGTRYDFSQWSGNYIWVQDDTALSKTTNAKNYVNDGNKIWVRGQKITLQYQFQYKAEYINNEWFKRLTLGTPADKVSSYKVRVVTMTPDALNLPENQHYIDEAGLFYVNAKVHNSMYQNMYENYSQEGKSLTSAQKAVSDFNTHDLSWTSVLHIFMRAAGIGCYKAAMIYDSSLYSEDTICNVAKLFLMTNQRNMIDFYNAFLNTKTTTHLITEQTTASNRTGSTGSFVRPDAANQSPTSYAALYWNSGTFLYYGLDANGNWTTYTDNYKGHGIYNEDMRRQTTDLTNNVLVTNGQEIFNRNFAQPFSRLPDDSATDAKDHLTEVNEDGSITTPSSFTIADLADVITNGGAGYENTGGVAYPGGGDVEGVDPGSTGSGEIPPDDTAGTGDTSIRFYKRILNIEPTADFTESENQIRSVMSGYTIQIINMTSMQFNSSIEDINSRYDMIFIGSGAGRYNLHNQETDFNGSNLDQFIYFQDGENIDIMEAGKKTNVTYTGNDITSQKKNELTSFLNAGYPIVLDKYMYECDNNNNNVSIMKKVQNGTNIRTFISASKTKTANFLNLDSYLGTGATSTTKRTFTLRLQNALGIVRPNLQLVAPVIPSGSEVNYVYANPSTEILTIRFMLPPKGMSPSSYYYNASLYIDENGDGIYDPSEKVNVVSKDGSNWEGLRESNYRTYTYQYDMSGLNGVYQWKVMVERDGKSDIRDILTGYAANREKENINILQITENDSTALSLESRAENYASLIYKYTSPEKLLDYTISFDTLTVQQFLQLYAATPYTSLTAATSDKLSKYHLIILDNPDTVIPETNGAAQNIRDEIDKNLGVIFTKDALGFASQASYYNNSDRNSFLNRHIYNYINRYALPGQLYIYSNLGTYGQLSLDSTYQKDYLTKANDGTITRYPYQIAQAIRTAKNSFSDFAAIDYNLAQNQRLVGWYCLSDEKSPLFSASESTENQGLYSSSPNDVKNNYYLFSNRSTYYSGITLSAADHTGNDNEIKLFINTIIAAFKYSHRVVSVPPVIEYTKPVPVTEADLSKTIELTQADIVDSDFIIQFEISESSSDMNLNILLDGANPSGSWNENIYEVSDSGAVSTTPIPINNTSKAVSNGTYAVKIPVTELTGAAKVLRITATNGQGNTGFADVTLKYAQDPVVTIKDPVPIPNASSQIIYVDLDFNAADSTDNNSGDELRIVFNVDQAVTNVHLAVASNGVDITGSTLGSAHIRKITGGVEENTDLNLADAVPKGDYALYIPLSQMEGCSSRDITITATDLSGNSGSAAVTLLRRSLFPLD